MSPKILAPGLTITLLLTFSLPAFGVAKSWNSASNSTWNVGSNWTPPGVPVSADTVTLGDVIGTTGTRTTLDISPSIALLTMINGNDLDTAAFELTVLGGVSLDGAGTAVLLKPNGGGVNNSLNIDFIDVAGGALVHMIGGRLEVDGNTGDGVLDITDSTMTGFGFIDLEDDVPANASRFTLNNSTLNVGNTGDGIILLTDIAQTLTVNATDIDATADLDQVGSIINLLPSGTFDLNVPIVPVADGFYSGTMNLLRKSTLDVEDAWSFDGTMNVNTQAGAFASQTAGPANLHGGSFTMSGGSINLDNTADHLIIDLSGAFTTTAGTINFTQGKLQFDSTGTIGAGTDFANGINNTELILNATLTVNDDDWDWDGNGGADNVITINDLGQLNANLTNAAADDNWTGVMNINGGILSVQGNSDNWINGSTINVGGTTLTQISGDEMTHSGTITVSPSASLNVNSSNVWDLGSFVINGNSDLNGLTTWAGTSVTGAGTLQQDSDATVTENTTIAVATYDFDGNTGSTVDITINSGVTFTVNSTAIDTSGGFNGNFNINSGILDVNNVNWSLNNLGNINLINTGAAIPTLAAGGTLTVDSGAQIAATGSATIATDVVYSEGSILNANTAATSINHSGQMTLAGGDVTQSIAGSTLSNNGGLVVTGVSAINVTTFDWDQSTTIVQAGGDLDINVTNVDAGNDTHDGTIDFQGGLINVNVADNTWVAEGVIRSTSGGTLFGDRIEIGDDVGVGDADIDVNGGTMNIGAPVTFFSDAAVDVAAGSTLTINNSGTIFTPVNGVDNASFTGGGTLRVVGAQFDEVTTFNMVGGTVALDGGLSGNGGIVILTAGDNDLNASLTINAAAVEDYGFATVFPASASELNIANAATLTVNLTPDAEWTVFGAGIINYAGDAATGTIVAGSDINMNGTLNVTGDGQFTARADVGGTINILTAAEDFSLIGGSFADPNTLAGGTINGPGILSATTGDILVGHGTINAEIVFVNNARLIAQDGLLDVNGVVTDVGRIGTGNDAAVLDIAAAWNTNVAEEVLMQGGTLQGAAITNDLAGGINGRGLITASVLNNTRIDAEGGGTLTLRNQTPGNLDGAGVGSLNAISGNLTVVYAVNTLVNFGGTVRADAGQEFFGDVTLWTFAAGSTLDLNGGTFRSNRSTVINGTVDVAAGPDSTISNPNLARFGATSSTTLNGNLRLVGLPEIQAGATFTGGGSLINTAGSTLTLADGADVDVLLENQGTLVLGTSPGQTLGLDFEQTAGGTWNVELGGTGLNDYDRMTLTGLAQVDGTLNLSLLAPYVPTLADPLFTILTASSVSGTFDTVIQPPTMPAGLAFNVIYNGANIQLQVANALLIGDYNNNGTVDTADYVVWRNGGPLQNDPTPGVQPADYDVWRSHFGQTAGSGAGSAASSIPEPTTLLQLILVVAFASRWRQRRA